MNALLLPFYLFILASALALFEIQIEGKYGWAEKLPTWRPSSRSLIARIYARVVPGKELTGYHIMFFITFLLIFHFPFLFGYELSIENWVKILSLMLMVMTAEDFLWFVFNPAFGIKKFFTNKVPWHTKRVLYVPIEYFISISLSFVILTPLFARLGVVQFYSWLINILVFTFCILVVSFILLLKPQKLD